jgi:SAM-dependent methyltransferase
MKKPPLPLSNFSCWVCGSKQLELVRHSSIRGSLSSEIFAISDSNYGTTGEIHRCKDCGFLQCSSLKDVISFYEDLLDQSYETLRAARALQAKRILKVIKKYHQDGRLLDIGAGSGILVEQAIKMGYHAEGVEPSRWLYNKAKEYGLPVHLGVFPHPGLNGPYDVVTIIDVIEHVSEPMNLVFNIQNVIAKNGIVVAVTPDIDSFIARLLGWKWWHFRVAHIGYFNRKTFEMLFTKGGFLLISMSRPTWYFTVDYLIERTNKYLPRVMRIPVTSFLKKITIPLNLRDSMLAVLRLNREG